MEDTSLKSTPKKHSRVRLFYNVMKAAHMIPILVGFVIYYFIMTTLIFFLAGENTGLSNIANFGDAMWYTFASIFTIGYGDIWVSSFLGRILTVLLVIYGVFIIALIPAVFTSYFQELFNRKREMTSAEFVEDLENLEDLPKERLAEISAKVRDFKKRKKN